MPTALNWSTHPHQLLHTTAECTPATMHCQHTHIMLRNKEQTFPLLSLHEHFQCMYTDTPTYIYDHCSHHVNKQLTPLQTHSKGWPQHMHHTHKYTHLVHHNTVLGRVCCFNKSFVHLSWHKSDLRTQLCCIETTTPRHKCELLPATQPQEPALGHTHSYSQ